ncbi:MAG: hypothetical protein ACYS99_20715, partial [Planctomycetota bacterium]
MSVADVHAILVRRLDFLHQTFLEASADLAAVQFERVGQRCNHENWLVGHPLWEKDVLLVEWPTGDVLRPDGLTQLYGFGSIPQDAGACPDIEELRGTIADLHAPMLARLGPDSLTQSCVGAPEVFP